MRIKTPPKVELPVIPTANLVDIAILLIIFYMACSHFISGSAGKITPPKSPGPRRTSTFTPPTSRPSTSPPRGPTCRPCVTSSQPSWPPAAASSGVAAIIKGRTNDDERTVMFKCDAGVNRAVFEPTLNAIVQAGGLILAVGENVPQPEITHETEPRTAPER